MQNQIISKDNEKIKQFVKLASSVKARRDAGMFVAETPKLVLDIAQSSAQVQDVFYTQEALQKHPAIEDILANHYIIAPAVEQKIAGQKTPSGVYATVKMPTAQPFLPTANEKYIFLEDVQDPANVGTILRTAVAFGFQGAVLTGACADPFSQKALRASMGAALKLPLYFTGNLQQEIEAAQNAGVTVVATALQNAQPMTTFAPKSGIAVCIGNEGNGLSEKTIEMADVRLYIPMEDNVESLNAAAAATIFMWHFRETGNA